MTFQSADIEATDTIDAYLSLSRNVFDLSFTCVPVFQLHPELSAIPEQHDSGGLHDGAGCSVPAGD